MRDDAGKLDRVLFELGRGSDRSSNSPEWAEGYSAAIEDVRRAVGALGQGGLGARPFRVEGRGYAPFVVLAPSARAVAEALAAFARAVRSNTGDAPIFLVHDPLEAERRIGLVVSSEFEGRADQSSAPKPTSLADVSSQPSAAAQRCEDRTPHLRLVDLAHPTSPSRSED